MIRAVVGVTQYTTQGWDNYTDRHEEYFSAATKEQAESLAKERVKELKAYCRKGDFGITLGSYDAEIVRFEKVEII